MVIQITCQKLNFGFEGNLLRIFPHLVEVQNKKFLLMVLVENLVFGQKKCAILELVNQSEPTTISLKPGLSF